MMKWEAIRELTLVAERLSDARLLELLQHAYSLQLAIKVQYPHRHHKQREIESLLDDGHDLEAKRTEREP
jgi:hypothetical protein